MRSLPEREPREGRRACGERVKRGDTLLDAEYRTDARKKASILKNHHGSRNPQARTFRVDLFRMRENPGRPPDALTCLLTGKRRTERRCVDERGRTGRESVVNHQGMSR